MLYIVPTPIGNLEDMTLRAIRILREVDVVFAEDTRVTGKLFKYFEIETPLSSFHTHNEHHKTQAVLQQIKDGKSVALVSDAGTPGISDPGFLLGRAAKQEGIQVSCLPGATAIIPALVNSGIPCDRFHFEGFLPHKKGRQTRLKYLATLPNTFALYESPFRLLKCLQQLADHCGEDRQACVCRELTKIYEESVTDTLAGLIAYYEGKKVKGEIVIVVAGG